jgi:hypothetical protein
MAQDLDDVLVSSIEEENFDLPDNPQGEEPVKPETPTEDDLPEKYRGKTPKEIAAMHQEAEKLIGKQGSEVGELRRVVDDYIRAQTSKDLKTQEPELDDGDFFVDPKSTVNKAIDNHPAILEAKQASFEMKKADTLSRLGAKYPNFMETVEDPAFGEWIKSSKVRTELFVRAERNLDYDSADELLSTWKEKQSITKKALDTSKMDRDKQLQTADVGSNSSNEKVSKKKYRRSDIIRLMQTDRTKYDALSEEILKAYAEGRVI